MRLVAAALIIGLLAQPSAAVVIWDESVNGELSITPATPTPVVFVTGSNIIKGTVINSNQRARDYITFTLPPDHTLTSLNLLEYTLDDIGFMAFNGGNTSFIPGPATDLNFLSGIHITPADVGLDLMDFFVNRNVTSDSLADSELGPGTYCWLIQQTSPELVSYSVEFIVTGPVPTKPSTWSAVKALYR